MHISEILKLSTVHRCEEFYSKYDALRLISQYLGEQCILDKETIYEQILEREKIGSTALGKGLALPHIRTKSVTKPIVSLVSFIHPVQYDKESVNFLFGMLVPEDSENLHLQILSQLAQLFQKDQFRGQLKKCKSDYSLFKVFNNEALRVTRQ